MVFMETLKVQVKEKKAHIFRERAMKAFGHSKGAISNAMNSAMDMWLDKWEGKKSLLRAKDFRGSASDLKYSSALKAQKKAVELMGKAD